MCFGRSSVELYVMVVCSGTISPFCLKWLWQSKTLWAMHILS